MSVLKLRDPSVYKSLKVRRIKNVYMHRYVHMSLQRLKGDTPDITRPQKSRSSEVLG